MHRTPESVAVVLRRSMKLWSHKRWNREEFLRQLIAQRNLHRMVSTTQTSATMLSQKQAQRITAQAAEEKPADSESPGYSLEQIGCVLQYGPVWRHPKSHQLSSLRSFPRTAKVSAIVPSAVGLQIPVHVQRCPQASAMLHLVHLLLLHTAGT